MKGVGEEVLLGTGIVRRRVNREATIACIVLSADLRSISVIYS